MSHQRFGLIIDPILPQILLCHSQMSHLDSWKGARFAAVALAYVEVLKLKLSLGFGLIERFLVGGALLVKLSLSAAQHFAERT